MHAIIIGAGIGGLTTALALARRKIDVTLYESVREIRPLGVGINLLPHSVKELTELGLQPQLAAVGIETAELIYFNRHGQQIWQEPRGLAAGYRWPQYSIHRGELQMILYRAAVETLGAGRIHLGHHLTRAEQHGEQVVAHFTDAAGIPLPEARADLLIAADGIHSAVRRQFHPDEGPPRFSGRLLWRAVTRAAPFLTGRSMIMAGYQDQKFVCYPISRQAAEQGASLINWIAELRVSGDTPERSDWNRRVEKSVFAPRFDSWRFDWLDIPALIAGAEAVYEFPMVDRDPLPRWSQGRITLLGDAAHPMYPIGSNGASQAILDARALADCLTGCPKKGDAVEHALAAYEAQRLPPTANIVMLNRQNGPEQVMQLAEERAPQGFAHIHDIIPAAELEQITGHYKVVAGFDKERLNRVAASERT
jgi:2-polyprenyl-6-methoxyphenol hydroxylase-like FAD-dependent oxidoreductase